MSGRALRVLAGGLAVLLVEPGCAPRGSREPAATVAAKPAGAPTATALPEGAVSPEGTGEMEWTRQRNGLVAELEREGIRDPAVLRAIAAVPRHRFVPEEVLAESYGNYPLPIGHGQTISQPYVVAAMSEAARLAPDANVLEVGTGSGYQAAVLAELLGLGPEATDDGRRGRLASIEIVPDLAERSASLLARLGYREVAVRAGDGYRGWPERAPFDAILVTAAPDHVPEPLKQQLAVGGRLVIPVGDYYQELKVIIRTPEGFREEMLFAVRFVPMRGEAENGGR